MIIIENDDDAYLAWLESNPYGFVVNVSRTPRVETTRLHRANCRHISTPEQSNWTTNQYIKVCSGRIEELELWAVHVPVKGWDAEMGTLEKGQVEH